MMGVQNKMQNGKIKYFSMFTGVGGFELGIEGSENRETTFSKDNIQSGRGISNDERRTWGCDKNNRRFECIGFSEINKYANQLLAKRFPNIPNFGDCTKIEADKLPDFDMLCGGFPCQSFSIAGKRRGFQDTRGTMFFHIARILEVKRPKLVFLENVKGLLNHDKGETFRVIIQALEELGYDVQWMVLNSKFFGVPQNRERVFIIGSLRGERRPEILPFRICNKEPNGEYVESQTGSTITSTYHKGNKGTLIHNVYGGFGEGIRESTETSPTSRTPKGGGHLPMILIRNCSQCHKKTEQYTYADGSIICDKCHVPQKTAIPVLTPDRLEKRQNGRRFKENGDDSFTLTKTDIHGVSDGSKIRRLTPTECERLQGFPDGWTSGFSDTQRYKMMGNAVTTKVISAIASRLFVFSVNTEQGDTK
jgi:DNA (cytosine-5)-methyltransferase 1